MKKIRLVLLVFICCFLKYTFAQQIHVEEGEDDGILITDAGADGIQIDSAGIFGIRIVDPKIHGLFVDKAGTDGIFLNFPADDGVHIFHAGDNGIEILGPANQGALISNPGGDGIEINSPVNCGIKITDAGNFGMEILGSGSDGISVSDASTAGLRITNAGEDGIAIHAPLDDGITIHHPVDNGVVVDSAGGVGVEVTNGHIGLRVLNTYSDGLIIHDVGDDGINISNPKFDGIDISETGHIGLLIHNAGSDGIQILNTEDDGIHIISPVHDGIYIEGAGERAAYLTNDSGSSLESVRVQHGNDSEFDLFLGGHGRMATHGSYILQLDANDNAVNEKFGIRQSAAQGGADVFNVYENGNGGISGNFSKGGGSFKIDHPLDPENKYLYHSFVESPDMMNVYNGNVILDDNGEAMVVMDEWFEALNRDFRYQLTSISAPGPNLFIAEKIKKNSFKIGGGNPGSEVSWQVTGIRQDPFANENRIETEVMKENFNRGKYLHAKEWAKVKGLPSLQHVAHEILTVEINSEPSFSVEYEKFRNELIEKNTEVIADQAVRVLTPDFKRSDAKSEGLQPDDK